MQRQARQTSTEKTKLFFLYLLVLWVFSHGLSHFPAAGMGES
jgi:hypothetical protein